MGIYTESPGNIKIKWNEVIIKNGAFLIREGELLIKGVSEAYQWMGKGGAAQEVREMFL